MAGYFVSHSEPRIRWLLATFPTRAKLVRLLFLESAFCHSLWAATHAIFVHFVYQEPGHFYKPSSSVLWSKRVLFFFFFFKFLFSEMASSPYKCILLIFCTIRIVLAISPSQMICVYVPFMSNQIASFQRPVAMDQISWISRPSIKQNTQKRCSINTAWRNEWAFGAGLLASCKMVCFLKAQPLFMKVYLFCWKLGLSSH